jgi:hypothetical protein
MVLWVYKKYLQEWEEQKNVFFTLSKIIEPTWNDDVLISSDNVSKDHETITSMIDIIRHAQKEITLIIGIPHPTKEFFNRCMQRGASEVWAINDSTGTERTYTTNNSKLPIKTGETICPALHVKDGDPIELSVCGKRNNRLILVMHHFRQWCRANYMECPHWQGKTSD